MFSNTPQGDLMVRDDLNGFPFPAIIQIGQKGNDKLAEMMDEREDDLSINLPSAVPPSSAENRNDVMVDIGGLLSLCVHVCLCDVALIQASHIQYMFLLYMGTGRV